MSNTNSITSNTNSITVMVTDAGNVRPSSCVEIAGAVDVDVDVRIDDRRISGEVTLAPRQYDGRLAAYGDSPDHWLSGDLLRVLRDLDSAAYRAALDTIEAAATEAAASA